MQYAFWLFSRCSLVVKSYSFRSVIPSLAPSRAFITLFFVSGILIPAGACLVFLKPFDSFAIAYQDTASSRVQQWQRFVTKMSISRLTDQQKVAYTQNFFKHLLWRSDNYQWGADDFWATPIETIVANGGDCEDLAIAKYFTLLHAGVSPEKIRVSYVRSLILAQAHVVLLYFPSEDQSPWVIDNLEQQVYTLNERQDLEYVYSFDQQSLWLAGFNQQIAGVSSRDQIEQWNALLNRLQQQLLL